MRYLGLDLGTRTLGIAISDPTATIATFHKSIRFNDSEYEELLPIIDEIVKQNEIKEIVLGLPKNMNNSIGPRGQITLEFKELVEEELKIPVVMQDERLSTVEATNYLIQADMSRKKRKTKIDGVAATIILQTYLDKMKGMK